MPFRDNDEATRARAEALAEEVEELRKERDELKAEKEARDAEAVKKAPPPAATKKEKKKKREKKRVETPPSSRDSSPPSSKPLSNRGKIVMAVIGVAIVGGVAFVVVRNEHKRAQARADYEASRAAHDGALHRWNALTTTEPCVRAVSFEGVYTREAIAKNKDAKQPEPFLSIRLDAVQANCTSGAKDLSQSKTTNATEAKVLGGWLAAEAAVIAPAKKLRTYYDGRDYVEDHFAGAPQLWTALESSLDLRRDALAQVRAVAVPAWHTEIRALQRTHETISGRDEEWWRIEIGLALWEADLAWMDAAGVTREQTPDYDAAARALRDPVTALLSRSKDAPPEVRRDLRKYQYLTDPMLAGQRLSMDALYTFSQQLDFLWDLRDKPPVLPPVSPEPPDDD